MKKLKQILITLISIITCVISKLKNSSPSNPNL